MSERRAHKRANDHWTRTAKATLRPGHPISIVNISHGGALVDGVRPMRPGTRVLLQIVTRDGTIGLSALVLRCGVNALSAEGGVVYRGALKFDDREWGDATGSRSLRPSA